MNDPCIKFVEPIADIEKNGRERLRITVETNGRGSARVKLREWFHTDGTLRPGREGLDLRADYLDQVIAGLTAARLKIAGGGAL